MSKLMTDYLKRFGNIERVGFTDGKDIIIEFNDEAGVDYAILNLHIAIVSDGKDSKHTPILLSIKKRERNVIILDPKVRSKGNISHIKIFHVENKTTYKKFRVK